MIQVSGVSKAFSARCFFSLFKQYLSNNKNMSENIVFLDGKTLTPETLVSLQKFDSKIDLTESAWEAVKKSREVSFSLETELKIKKLVLI